MIKPKVSFETNTAWSGGKYTVLGAIYTDRIDIERVVHAGDIEKHTAILFQDVQEVLYGRKGATCAWIAFILKDSAQPICDGVPYNNPRAIVFSGVGETILAKNIYEDINKWFNEYKKNPEAATINKEKEEHQRRVFKGKSRWTVFNNYDSEIHAYDDRIEVTKTGKVGGVPEKMVVYYSDVISVTCYKTIDYPGCWFAISVAGAGSKGQSVGIVNVGKFAMGSAVENPWKDPYQVNFHYSHYKELQKYCETVQEILGEYRKRQNAAEKTVVQQSESTMDKLKKLKELQDLGILNDAEYEEKRQKLLSEI